MNRGERSFTIVVLTEDSSGDAHETIRRLLRSMLKLIDPDHQHRLISFEPPDERVKRSLHGNHWKGKTTACRQQLVDLRQYIASKVCRGDCVVVFHVDGDRPFSRVAESENVEKLKTMVEIGVEQLVRGWLQKVAGERDATDPMERLLRLVPCYSIEAWLYQNTETAIGICKDQYDGRDVERFEQWATDRALLDEVDKPKEVTCLRDRHNAQLAERFPASEVYDGAEQGSFHEAVDGLMACTPLIEALRATHDTPPADGT